MNGFISVLKSKIHGASVVESRLDYDGSITIDSKIVKEAGLIPGERVLVANLTNGNRFETYVIEGTPGSRIIAVNGAAAHLADPGDRLIIMSFKFVEESQALNHRPRMVYLDRNNEIVAVKEAYPEERSVVSID
ncbi:MAG: aspartate 1-decarboxylase [Actinobacteria bacterium]|nr:aspartate 1-decarboxylase [Actinomycetota bacterium]